MVEVPARRGRLARWLLSGWRPRWRHALNLLWAWSLGVLVLAAIVAVHGGISSRSPASVVVAVLVIAVVDAVLRPVLTALAVALSWFGVFVIGLLTQSIVTYVGLTLAPGIHIDTFWDAIGASWLYALFATVLSWLLAVDADDAFISHCVRQATRGRGAVEAGDMPGVVFVQLDGVPRPVLDWALNAGNLPNLSRWVRSGGHIVRGWTARVPSTTPVSQAGLLHGSTEGIPAFRWYEKDSGRMLVANRPADAAEIEARISNGRGLLADDGASISNLFSGDAPVSLLSMSGASGRRRDALGPSSSYASFFTHPFGFSRALILTLGEMAKELHQARRQRVLGIEPRIRRGGSYVLLRGVTNVMLRDLNVALVIEQLMRGTKSVYVDFVDYDEIAHHAGPVRPESLRALEGLDEVLGQLERVAAQAPRPYSFVVVSDHGQSQGATFRQRYGMPLEELVRDLMGGTAQMQTATGTFEEWGPVNTFLSQLTEQESVSAGIARRVLRDRARTGLGPTHTPPPKRTDDIRDAAAPIEPAECVTAGPGGAPPAPPAERGERASVEGGGVSSAEHGEAAPLERGERAAVGRADVAPVGGSGVAPVERGECATVGPGDAPPVGSGDRTSVERGEASPGDGGDVMPVGRGDVPPVGRGNVAAAECGDAASAERDDRATFGPGGASPVEGGERAGGGAVAVERPEVVVAASGNLGLVYFPRVLGRLTYEEIEQRWPGMVGALANHPGIAFAVVESQARGPVAVGRDGLHYLADGTVDGTDPLAGLPGNAADDLLRVTRLEHAPDIYLNSMVDAATGEVAAFEELVGCHGGLGGWQTEAMLVHPSDWPAPDEPLVGAEAVHQLFVGWLERLGHRKGLR
jgi:uncharacterized membrane protein YvlD (DUF360 family)